MFTLRYNEDMKKRIVLCMGAFCNQSGQAQPLYDRLYRELGEPLPPFMARGRPVSWETANCLSMCGAGPNLILYPDNLEFHAMDLEKLEAFIAEYLRDSD